MQKIWKKIEKNLKKGGKNVKIFKKNFNFLKKGREKSFCLAVFFGIAVPYEPLNFGGGLRRAADQRSPLRRQGISD